MPLEEWEDDENRNPEQEPRSRGDWVLIVFFLVIILGPLAYTIFGEITPGSWFFMFFMVSWFVMLIVHELGHIWMARRLGWTIEELIVGMGPTWKRFRWGDMLVELKLAPIEDTVVPVPALDIAPGRTRFWIHFAGPLAEWLVLLAVVLLAGLDTLLTETDHLGVIALQALALAILVRTFFCLVPHYISYEPPIPNDGLAMVRSFMR